MRNKIIITAIGLGIIGLQACTLEGVKDNHSKQSDHLTLVDTVQNEETSIEEPKLIEVDTLENGNPNEMVWNGENGLRIEWTKKSTEPKLSFGDVVMVNYKARVARGEVFDSNDEIGHPVPLKLGIGVLIEGWELGMLEMHPGDVGRIMIPSKLAYGETGLGDIVPVKADVIVNLEIVEKIEPITLENGIKVYKYESEEAGEFPVKNQSITFDYFAFRANNKPGMYDNSYEKGTPFTFRFENDNVIDGLHIGFSQLKAGEKAFIDIPSSQAYGSKGIVDLVPKNTDIVYDVRVEKIE